MKPEPIGGIHLRYLRRMQEETWQTGSVHQSVLSGPPLSLPLVETFDQIEVLLLHHPSFDL